MADRRRKNGNWTPGDATGSMPTWERVQVALLMDLRDELQTLNRLLACQNFLGIPNTLRIIAKQTNKPARKRKPKAA